MLTEAELNELLDSRVKGAEYVSGALYQAVCIAIERVQDPKTTPSAVSQLIESLRKVRSDLVGDNQQTQMPTMMVNIKFDSIQGTPPSSLEYVEGNLVEH